MTGHILLLRMEDLLIPTSVEGRWFRYEALQFSGICFCIFFFGEAWGFGVVGGSYKI